MLIELLLNLFDKLGLIVLVAFFLSRLRFIKGFLSKEKMLLKEKIVFSIIFGVLGIIGTYSGISVNGAIANSRSVGVIVAGLFGGPFVGLFAGLIAGIHRLLLPTGKFTALACGLSTIAGGLIAGYARKYMLIVKKKWLYGVGVTVLIESIQMGMILLISKPFADALILVEIIFIPMAIINSLGTGAFILLMHEINKENEYNAATKASLALKIASLTLPILRLGLNSGSAKKVCSIILSNTEVDAVAITDNKETLAHVNLDDKSTCDVSIGVTKHEIINGEYIVASNKKQLSKLNEVCSYNSAIIVPLYLKNDIIGYLKLYKTISNNITLSDIKMAKGLAYLFSTQLELGQIVTQEALLIKTEMRVLQAQIHPHFLFNALNTIISFCRTDASQARELLIKLSHHLRTSFNTNDVFISIGKEIEQVKNYLDIEEARFSNRLKVEYDIDTDMNFDIPPLILQPLVENALIHGFVNKSVDCNLSITIQNNNNNAEIIITDNGKGISKERLKDIVSNNNCGIGLRNVIDRIKGFYDTDVIIDSTEEIGTSISILIPQNKINMKENVNIKRREDDKSSSS